MKKIHVAYYLLHTIRNCTFLVLFLEVAPLDTTRTENGDHARLSKFRQTSTATCKRARANYSFFANPAKFILNVDCHLVELRYIASYTLLPSNFGCWCLRASVAVIKLTLLD